MKILVTGGNGQVGFELQRQLCLLGEVYAPDRAELDLADAAAVDQWLKAHQPTLIVNAAAYTAVDRAEEEPELARRLNAELPAQLAAYSAARGLWLVHYSSDYVYSGDGEAPWQEESATCPLSLYGQTKLAGDEAVQASGCAHLIFRTSWVYGARGNNFMKTMLRLGRERDALKVVSDQVGAPTPARLTAQVTTLAIPLLLRAELTSGVYHLAPRGETSWHGFACEIFRQALESGEALAITPGNVAPIPTAEYPTPAQRPQNSRLAVDKLEKALGLTLPDWHSQLELTLEEYLSL
ncbi:MULTISPECIES: dTDP-4-dehydrorhamnose reductase [unclassified Halomonas]|uniref:dTDP-4-dehydrorhamnose reductase n=1 Tax=unclassified Halomonas TaxID=2609666 RepID=UPI0028847F82|nr:MULTISPECIES: dTDP-4-dehydrorhamnose reductase [unclassified Halomonas]MDT0500417.1 dTDP-4-dehydrorhamnose reductase [Halomonas sp. PAR7]MDT0511686.1 dTDP-4-dehydrorhamnose reductase [Halomonas sp. LES1]MDT0590026.1 dTDP-4-dehydrorhamnose reductase [Halomonas sp. PAR8]